MKTRHFVSNNWQPWLAKYAEEHGLNARARASVATLLAREVDWIVRLKDEEFAERLAPRRSKFKSLGDEIKNFDSIGKVKIAFWDWIFEE